MGLGLGFGQMFGDQQAIASSAAASTAVWNGSSDTPASSADWTRSNANLTANRTSTGAGFWALLRGSTAKASGTITVTVDAIGGGTGVYIGFETGSETQFPGQAITQQGISYKSDGTIQSDGGTVVASLATYTTGDVIKCVKSGSSHSFYKNGALQTTYNTTTDGANLTGALYPAASNGNSTGTQLTLDASLW